MTQNPYMPPQMAQVGNMMYPFPHGYMPSMPAMTTAAGQLPIVKNYSINTSGPTDDHMKLSMIYEDVLPKMGFQATSTTVGERLSMLDFVRSVMLKRSDGEEISLDGKDENNLLSYLKFLELNPYSQSSYTNNPYRGLPDGMLIYRSCYPIRHNPKTGAVECAQEAIGMNVRIYRMSNRDVEVNQRRDEDFHKSDIWREIAYYEFIREDILKKKVCPNFVLLYAYYICPKSGVDYDKLSSIRGAIEKKTRKQPNFILAHDSEVSEEVKEKITNEHGVDEVITRKILERKTDPETGVETLVEEITRPDGSKKKRTRQLKRTKTRTYRRSRNPPPIAAPARPQAGGDPTIYVDQAIGGPPATMRTNALTGTDYRVSLDKLLARNALNDTDQYYNLGEEATKGLETYEPNPDAYEGHSLVALTEAPTYSLYSWASNSYFIEGNIRKMTYNGYYNEKVWMSILFQLAAALYVMQLNNISIQGMNIANNIYIKDIKTSGHTTNYWKYKIDNIDYYVPNYGYLLLVDSNFRQVDTASKTVRKTRSTDVPRIVGEMFNDKQTGGGMSKTDIESSCRSAFQNCFSTNAFGNDFYNRGGNAPPEGVLKKMNQISHKFTKPATTAAPGTTPPPISIGDVIFDQFPFYLNNRIGTYLKEGEIENVQHSRKIEFSKGEIAVYQDGSTFRFVIFIERKTRMTASGIPASGPEVAVVLSKKKHTDDSSLIRKVEVGYGLLRHYSDHEGVEQVYKPNEGNLGEDDLLETYKINSK